ncbi:hypothetical protein PG985_012176 [Apiospora marii]|uniref:C3H1-type domain-containing protein n=1 Tax=Apiospora marii TaxID=335849 RepID=A0ABR1RE15_9PEZI
MSQPPYAYGQYPGQQPQQNYPYIPNTSQPPGLSYGAVPQAPSSAFITGNFAAINSSFEQNGSRIPGLGMSGGFPSSVAAPSYPAVNDSLWRQGNVSMLKGAPATAPAVIQPQKIVHQQADLQASAPAPADASHFGVRSAQTAGSRDILEEGELSEGEFEDLYEPRHSTNATKTKPSQASRPSSTALDNQGSTGDADESSIYDTGSSKGEINNDSTSASLPAVEEDDEEYSPGEYGESDAVRVRDRSGSYSPYLSPREVHKDAPTIARAPPRTERTVSTPNPVPSTTRGISSAHKPVGLGTPSGQTSNPAQSQSASGTPYKSVTEAKKKAQEAILGLWPLKVRYQNYIDEGVDPEVVKTLFAELGLDLPVQKAPMPAVDSGAQKARNTAIQTSPSEVTSSALPNRSANQPVSKPSSAGSVNMADKKAEERKDKIARMLAEKKQKSVAAQDTTKTTASISPVVAAVPAPKPTESSPAQLKAKTKAENTLKLQQKLAALRKAQEEAEAKRKQEQTVPKQVPANVASQVQSSDRSAPNSAATTTPQRSGQNSPKADAQAGSPPATKVAGLALPTLSQPGAQARTLKRPVASDFDGYSSSNSMLKRTRTQERLIIDVSDEDDDDDEDVEMDIGSPIDGPPGAAIQSMGGDTPSRPNSLGTFPPLSTAPAWRHKSSPVQTPPEHNHKLDHLHRQIEEAKKRIAEAEAKKAAKKPNGSVTPVIGATPAPASNSSLKLPKLSELAKATQRAKSERRERITSYHLPIVDAALKEKQDRLKQLQMEAAQVELEVQARLEERNRLNAEVDALKDADTDSTNPMFQSPLPTPDQSFADDYTRSQPAAQSPIPTATPRSPRIPEANITQAPTSASVTANVNTTQDHLTKEPESQPEATEEDPASCSDKSDMDIDSSDSSSDEGEDMNIEPVETGESAASLIKKTSAASVEQAPSHAKEASRASSQEAAQEKEMDESDTSLSMAGSQSQTAIQVANDADASLQASVADVSVDEEDSYEPVLGQISSTDKLQGSDEEDGEVDTLSSLSHMILTASQIPDDDPYEPSPAQPVEAASEPNAKATSGEVQLRSPGERRLLTMAQAEEQSPTLSSKDLLSYESPLRFFRAYRFHPKYMKEVRGGLRSKTYSSRVDCNTPLCPSSEERKSCPNGPSCQYQHFSDMLASDSDIIASLGSVDSYNGEQKGRFIEGLRKVLSDLKSDSSRLKDFDSITSAILQYRRQFFGGDETKVLPLEGVAI